MFQLYVSIYVSITSISTKGIILFHNYKFISRIGFTSVLGRIIIGLASWQLSIYTSLNSHLIEQSEAQSQAKKTNTLFKRYNSEGKFWILKDPFVGLLLVILTSSINILVFYLLVLLAIYLQIDIYPRFI